MTTGHFTCEKEIWIMQLKSGTGLSCQHQGAHVHTRRIPPLRVAVDSETSSVAGPGAGHWDARAADTAGRHKVLDGISEGILTGCLAVLLAGLEHFQSTRPSASQIMR